MSLIRKKIAGLIMTLSAGNALALGLGEVSGQAVIGQPLRIEIPVLGGDGNMPAASCFRVRPPMTDIGTDFVLRNSRIQVVGDRGAAKLIVTHHALVREPVIGFAVAIACGFELSKDYILLSAFPTDTRPEVALPRPASPPVAHAAAPAAAAAPAPIAAPAAKPASVTATDKALRLNSDATLEDLARQKYPLQPKAREKFMRMMAQANPELKANDAVIAAGTELQIPAGLPQRRVGPYLGEGVKAKTAAPAPAAVEATAVPAVIPATPVVKPAGKDRLVVGGGPEMSEAKLLAEAERLTAILVEQTKSQDAVTETITRLEGTYSELQKRYANMDSRLKHIEAERLAEKAAPKPVSFDFVELLLAVVAGGAIGGVLLHLFQRQQPRRNPDAENEPPAIKAGFKLPWAKRAMPTPPAAAPAPATVAAVATVALAPVSSVEEAPLIEEALAPVTVEEAPATKPTDIPEFLKPKSPAAEPVAAESSEPGADDLDALSLDFPLMPEPTEEAPAVVAEPEPPALVIPELAVPDVAAPTAVEPPSLEPLALDFPMILPAAAQEEPAVENLTLDFPEILAPTAAEPDDGHVIEFESAAKDGQNALDFEKKD